MKETSYDDPQNLHRSQGKLDFRLAYKRGDNVSSMQFYSTDVIEHNSSLAI